MSTDKQIKLKTPKEVKKMAKGGKKLAKIKKKLMEAVSIGVSGMDIENLANKLIEEEGGKASFKMVPKYSWATCVNINSGIVHGIPKQEVVFEKGDVVSVDVGLFYKGFHTDTSFTKYLGKDKDVEKMLSVGKKSLENATGKAKVGNKVYDISAEMQKSVEAGGHNVIRSLVGHGIGKALHEGPQIPCFVESDREASPELVEGMVIAIEVMYTIGRPKLKVEPDGWTISTRDGKISALFEETVAVTKGGPLILTV